MTMTIGDRIAKLREFRDITQEQLAQRAGVSVDTVRKLEQGQRQSAYITTLRKLADALDVELERLIGQPTVTTDLPDEGGLLALRDAIQDVAELPGVFADGSDAPPDADTWTRAVRSTTALYWEGKYSDLTSQLPSLLREGRAVAREKDNEHVWRQLAMAYQLAASLATQTGHTAWAFQAVEKQLQAAQRASDPLMEGMGISTLSWVLLRQGRWEQAQQVAERKADALEPASYRRAKRVELAVYGNLLAAAATPAARQDRTDEAQEMLTLAQAAATRTGLVKAFGTSFGPEEITTYRVNIALAGHEPNPGGALEMARDVRLGEIPRPLTRARHRIDVSQAQYQTGDHEGALSTLLEVEREQPQWIRYQTLAAATVREMLEAERRRNSPLRGLAARLGVDPTL